VAHSDDILSRPLRRRDALVAIGGIGAGALWAACGSGDSNGAAGATTTDETASTAAACALTPEATEGPFWIPNHLIRRDITEGRPGLPLALRIDVVDAGRCKPIKRADVEIWHADAAGQYSSNRKRFLRGHQRSNADGRVRFDTIYPGWYTGRTPHIHIKVHVGGSVVHTGQLFFDDHTSDAVYRTSAYRSRGEPDTTNGSDSIYAGAGGSRAKVHLSRRRGQSGYNGLITVGVNS
jgi:protocatechuate 3,4-dioxygenase beta subunit